MKNQDKKSKSKFLNVGFRLTLAALFVSSVFYFAGPLYVRAFLPLFSYQMKKIYPNLKVKDIYVDKRDQISYDITVNFKIADENKQILAERDVPLHGGFMAKFMYICPIIIYTILLGWPGLSTKQRIVSIAVSIPLLVAVQLVDIPIYFVKRIEMSLAPDPSSTHFRDFWVYFINNGGRQFLALIVAMISIASVRIVLPKTIAYNKASIGRNDPCPCKSGKKYKKCCGR